MSLMDSVKIPSNASKDVFSQSEVLILNTDEPERPYPLLHEMPESDHARTGRARCLLLRKRLPRTRQARASAGERISSVDSAGSRKEVSDAQLGWERRSNRLKTFQRSGGNYNELRGSLSYSFHSESCGKAPGGGVSVKSLRRDATPNRRTNVLPIASQMNSWRQLWCVVFLLAGVSARTT
jgi:hypothetical protein